MHSFVLALDVLLPLPLSGSALATRFFGTETCVQGLTSLVSLFQSNRSAEFALKQSFEHTLSLENAHTIVSVPDFRNFLEQALLLLLPIVCPIILLLITC
eukprot:2370193-Rhodomonas_salina.3